MSRSLHLLAPGQPFPDPRTADATGLVAVGGGLGAARLVSAYRQGLFPWPLMGEQAPQLWFSPDPRFVLEPKRLHCPRSLRKTSRREPYLVSIDQRFHEVVEACATARRAGQEGTWITPALEAAYVDLFRIGLAHSVEVYRAPGTGKPELEELELVGGLYGVALGRVFFGESMFSVMSDASKIGFVWLVERLRQAGYLLVDCQQETDHLRRFGARLLDRDAFLSRLEALVDEDPSMDPWQNPGRLRLPQL